MVNDAAFDKAWKHKCTTCGEEHLFFKKCSTLNKPQYIIRKFDIFNNNIECYDTINNLSIRLTNFSNITIHH